MGTVRAEAGAAVKDPVVLVIHWLSADCRAGVIHSGRLLGEHSARVGRDQPVVLPHAVGAALASAGLAASQLDTIVAVLAPGGFTAVRSSVAYAHGLGLSLGGPVLGVTEGEALRLSLGQAGGREVWCCWNDRHGRILLDLAGGLRVVDPQDLPFPAGPVVLAGEAAAEVSARLAARGADVQLSSRRVPSLREIAVAGLRQNLGSPDHRWARPLYVEPPSVRSTVRENRMPPVP